MFNPAHNLPARPLPTKGLGYLLLRPILPRQEENTLF